MAEATAREDDAPVDLRLRLSEVKLKRATPSMGRFLSPRSHPSRMDVHHGADPGRGQEARRHHPRNWHGCFLVRKHEWRGVQRGDPTTTGLTTVSGAAYVQTLASLAGWIWFAVRL